MFPLGHCCYCYLGGNGNLEDKMRRRILLRLSTHCDLKHGKMYCNLDAKIDLFSSSFLKCKKKCVFVISKMPKIDFFFPFSLIFFRNFNSLFDVVLLMLLLKFSWFISTASMRLRSVKRIRQNIIIITVVVAIILKNKRR